MIRPENKTYLDYNLARLELFKRSENFPTFLHIVIADKKRFKVKSYPMRKKNRIDLILFNSSFYISRFAKVFRLHHLYTIG